jgi:hypothetical protein
MLLKASLRYYALGLLILSI